jgi:hypothetical protein
MMDRVIPGGVAGDLDGAEGLIGWGLRADS